MYVKPTQAIWISIEDKISNLFAARYQSASDWYNYGLDEQTFNQYCLDSVFPPEVRETINKLGHKYFDEYDFINVEIATTHEDPWPKRKDSYTIKLTKRILMPNKWHSPYYSTIAKPRVEDATICDIANRRACAMHKVQTERDAFLAKVRQLYDNAPSINALVKAWPPILDLLPQHVIDKINQKVERKTPEKVLEGVDVNSLSVHLLKARVAS